MKDAYYFSHDSNARQDEKILMLRAEHSWEGYGIYWALIEMMFESGDTTLHHNKIKGIAVSYNIDITLLQQVINTCIAEQLFTSDNDKFWSESLIRRKLKFQESKEKKSEAGKKGMAKRYGKQHNANGVITDPNKVKESKVNEIKGNEIDQVHVPVFDNPIKNNIEEWLKKYKVEYLIKNLEDISSFIGVVETEVIKFAIGESEGKTGAYPVTILNRLVREGKTTIEKVNPKPKAGEQSEKHEGESRHERHSPEDKPITGGAVGWLPSAAQRSANVIPLRDMSG